MNIATYKGKCKTKIPLREKNIILILNNIVFWLICKYLAKFYKKKREEK